MIAVDIVLQLISPVEKNAESKLIKKVYNSLKPDGYLLLELWDFKKTKQMIETSDDKVLRIWEEFPQSDPFQYGLFKIWKNDEYIVWDKIFIKRNNNEQSCFCNILKPYSKNEIKALLFSNGFSSVKIFDRWSSLEHRIPGEYIVLAQK